MSVEQPTLVFDKFHQVAPNSLEDFQRERRRVFHTKPRPMLNMLVRKWETPRGYQANMVLEPLSHLKKMSADYLTPFGSPDALAHIEKSREYGWVDYEGVPIRGEYYWVKFEVLGIPRRDMLNSPGSRPRDPFLTHLRFENNWIEVYGAHTCHYSVDFNSGCGTDGSCQDATHKQQDHLSNLHYPHWRVVGDGMIAQKLLLPRNPKVLQKFLPEMYLRLSLRNPVTEPRLQDTIVYGTESPFNAQLAVR